jgi:ubiquinone/menaquinone biosynthesis C-methylase UbiE
MNKADEINEKSISYIRSLQQNKEITEEYYRKSIIKTEQQKFIEKFLTSFGYNFSTIADVACGGGTLSYHLSKLYPNARFYLTDLNSHALEVARELCVGERFQFELDDIFEMRILPHNFFDAVFCWQTLMMLDRPEDIINSLLRLPKKGGKLFFMSLFNLEKDVDIYANIIDHTRNGSDVISYNTYSKFSVERWLTGKAENFGIHPFHPEADFSYLGRGLGSSTIDTDKFRLQVSGGYLMNWGLLEITK